MAVYVDNMRAKVGRMIMCHMLADTREELDAMADTIGVARRWIQYPGTFKEHYDIALSARAKAVAAGAVEIDMRDTAQLMRARREGRTYTFDPARGQLTEVGVPVPVARIERHCQNGRGDVCRAAQTDGIICPNDSCDIDDGIRS